MCEIRRQEYSRARTRMLDPWWLTIDMSRAPRPAAAVRPGHRSTTFGSVEQDPDEDTCVHKGLFAAASYGDLEVCVHGGRPVGSIFQFLTGSSSRQPVPALSRYAATLPGDSTVYSCHLSNPFNLLLFFVELDEHEHVKQGGFKLAHDEHRNNYGAPR